MDEPKYCRRSFLGFAAAGVAGAQTIAAEAMKYAGISTLGSSPGIAPPAIGMAAGGTGDYIASARSRLSLLKKALGFGLPEWKRRDLMQGARYKARQLDPDIASLRSISLQGKYQMQIDREYQRGIDAELIWAEGDLARELWAKEHGGRI